MIPNQDKILKFIRLEYDRLDKICGVDTSLITISLSSRMTRQLGYFTVKRKGFREELSIRIAERIVDDQTVFLDVIRHEYAHAVVHLRYPRGNHSHDKIWRSVCAEVGCVPKATRKAEDCPAAQT